jgi:hypothetical protein
MRRERGAIDEMLALPEAAVERQFALPVLSKQRIEIERMTRRTSEQEEFLMATTDASEWLEQWAQQREEEVREQAREEERQKLTRMLVRLLERRFGPDAEFEEALAEIETFDELLAVQDAIVDADSIDEVRRAVLDSEEL